MNDDINFLKELQHELNNQERDLQASPRFWVLMDYREFPAHEDFAHKISYYFSDGDFTEFETTQDLWIFLEDNYPDEIEDAVISGVTKNINVGFEDLWEWVIANLNHDGWFDAIPVQEESFIVPNTLFLTKAEAKRHIELNHYHYTDKVHTYAMTAQRAPKVGRLLKILETFDWDEIEELAEDKSIFLKAYVEKIMDESEN